MDRSFASGAAGSPPSYPGSPSLGYPTSGNPSLAVPATKPGPWWYYMISEELRKVITDAGLTPDGSSVVQLKAALDVLYQAKGTALGMKNLLINGGCQVAQRAAPSLSTTATYGAVDRFAAWGTGTAVSAGTISQDTASSAGRTGFALKLAGVTITGSGVVFARQRIESINAKRLKNQTASFSLRVYHDVGSNINYTITIRKPTVADNYGSTTTIATGSAAAVVTATDTLLKLENVAMGDCSNGIEIEVQAACGAVTTKNFSFTEWQAEEAVAASSFERRDIGVELPLCWRYYWAIPTGVTFPIITGYAGAGSQTVQGSFSPPVPMRVTPTASQAGVSYALVNCTFNTLNVRGPSHFDYAFISVAAGPVQGYPSGSAPVTFSAEL